MVARCPLCLRVCCSCGLQQAGSEGVHPVRNPLGFDLIVHDDAAANAVTIALRHDTSHGRRPGDRELQRPWQACSLNMLRFSIDVEIADVGHGPWWSQDLIRQVLGAERCGVVDFGVVIRGAFLRAEDAIYTRYSEYARTD